MSLAGCKGEQVQGDGGDEREVHIVDRSKEDESRTNGDDAFHDYRVVAETIQIGMQQKPEPIYVPPPAPPLDPLVPSLLLSSASSAESPDLPSTQKLKGRLACTA